MFYLLTTNNEEIFPDVIISFRKGCGFIVTDVATGFRYFVDLGVLIDNLKYKGEVVSILLNGYFPDLLVYITNDAEEGIEQVCEANRLLF